MGTVESISVTFRETDQLLFVLNVSATRQLRFIAILVFSLSRSLAVDVSLNVINHRTNFEHERGCSRKKAD